MQKHKELRTLITSRLERLHEVHDQMDDNSDLHTAIGAQARAIHYEWEEAQQFIDHYDKGQLQTSCVLMVNLLAEWHKLSKDFWEASTNLDGNDMAYFIGGHQVHELLSLLASELKINEGGSKCWPEGSC